jgi:hypothetical protein
MMGYDDDDNNQGGEYDNDNDDDDDDVITRLRRREMEGSPSREGDETVFSQYSVLPSLTRHKPRLGLIRRKPRLLQRPVLPLLTTTVNSAGEREGQGAEDEVDQWLESALGNTDTFETEIVEGEGHLDEWLDGVIQWNIITLCCRYG